MAEIYQWSIGSPEPKWSFEEARAMAAKLRSMAELHPGIGRELVDSAVMIEHLAHCTDVYRFRWVNSERSAIALRNPPRDAEKARHSEDR